MLAGVRVSDSQGESKQGKVTYGTLPLVVGMVEAIDIEAVRRELGPCGLSFGKDFLPEILQGGGFTREAASQADDGDIVHRG